MAEYAPKELIELPSSLKRESEQTLASLFSHLNKLCLKPVKVSFVQSSEKSIGEFVVHVAGVEANPYSFTVRDLTVAGVLHKALNAVSVMNYFSMHGHVPRNEKDSVLGTWGE